MQAQRKMLTQQVNGNGTPIRLETFTAPNRVVNHYYQKVDGVLISYKRVVHVVH